MGLSTTRLRSADGSPGEGCYGPLPRVRIFDRANIGSVTFTGSILETTEKARDSVVLTCETGQYRAGRVRRFLTHDPPGTAADADLEVLVADVQWYGAVPASHQKAERSMEALDCVIVRSTFVDDRRGNFWPVDKLAPCNLLAVPHKSGATSSGSDTVSNHLAIISRFASFMSKVPHVQ